MEVDGAQHRFVRGVFIIPGHGNVVGLGQALSQEAKHLEVYQGKNEQGMAQAAVAFAKQMKRKQICVATPLFRGPRRCQHGHRLRHRHRQQHSPAGAARRHLRLPSARPRSAAGGAHQLSTTTTNDAFKAVCRYWDRVLSVPSS